MQKQQQAFGNFDCSMLYTSKYTTAYSSIARHISNALQHILLNKLPKTTCNLYHTSTTVKHANKSIQQNRGACIIAGLGTMCGGYQNHHSHCKCSTKQLTLSMTIMHVKSEMAVSCMYVIRMQFCSTQIALLCEACLCTYFTISWIAKIQTVRRHSSGIKPKQQIHLAKSNNTAALYSTTCCYHFQHTL